MIPPMTVEGAMVGLLLARFEGRAAGAMLRCAHDAGQEGPASEELLRSGAALHRAAFERATAAANGIVRVGLDIAA